MHIVNVIFWMGRTKMVATVDGNGVVLSVIDDDGELARAKEKLCKTPADVLDGFAERFSRASTPEGRGTVVDRAVDFLMSL